MSKPKTLCNSCKRRLVRLDSDEITHDKWAKLRISIEFQPMIDRRLRDTRQSVSCSVDMRCQVCQIASSLVNNRLTKMQSNLSSAGRPLEQSPRRSMCSKCGQFMDSHDKNSCNKVWKHPRSAPQAAQLFAERVQSRGHTDRFACDHLRNALREIEDDKASSTSSASVLKLHSSLDTNRQLALTTVGYKGRDHDTKTLSYSTVRDLQRLGHLGLGKKAYWELARILRRDGVVFPAGGVKAAWDEKWMIFGEIFTPVMLNIEQSTDKSAKPVPTPFGFCIAFINY